jgi:hypothetical protein
VPEKENTSDGASLQQTKLDGFVQPIPVWTKEGLIDHVVELIAVEDKVFTTILELCFSYTGTKAFRIIDSGPFRRLFKYQ